MGPILLQKYSYITMLFSRYKNVGLGNLHDGNGGKFKHCKLSERSLVLAIIPTYNNKKYSFLLLLWFIV